MANNPPWSERSGAQRRRTFGSFGLLYGVITVVALAVGWIPIGALFGIGTIALAIAWYATDPEGAPRGTPGASAREKPAWLQAMDDPDAPDLSLPEYRDRRPGVPAPDAPRADGVTGVDGGPPAPAGTGGNDPDGDTGEISPDRPSPFAAPPPAAPPSGEA